MARKGNRRLVERGYRGLEHVPRERSAWDCTLAALAMGMRMDVSRERPDLGAWAARHGVAASARCAGLGRSALVLWHGTSRERADKISEHGLFHKKGLWTALHPSIPHSFCRGRAEEYGTEGAVVCIVLDRSAITEGVDFEIEGNGNVHRFFHGLGPEVVEYVLTREGMVFTGAERAREPAPWPSARFKRSEGAWVPEQKTPVRYSGAESYSTAREFSTITVRRAAEELGPAAPLELMSSVYACMSPAEAIMHDEVLDIIEAECSRGPQRGKWRTFWRRGAETEA